MSILLLVWFEIDWRFATNIMDRYFTFPGCEEFVSFIFIVAQIAIDASDRFVANATQHHHVIYGLVPKSVVVPVVEFENPPIFF
jgi:hypothetical protein